MQTIMKTVKAWWTLLSKLSVEQTDSGLLITYLPTQAGLLLKHDGTVVLLIKRHIHLKADEAVLLNCPQWQEDLPTRQAIWEAQNMSPLDLEKVHGESIGAGRHCGLHVQPRADVLAESSSEL